MPTLSWNTSVTATSYQVQVSTVSNFASTVFDQSGITATSASVTPALLNNTQYYWRVNATNAGGTSAWSTVWSFTTEETHVYLTSSTSAAAGIIYPNDSWGNTVLYESNDWNFTTPIPLYIVPEVGTVFGASDITIQWDNTMYSYAGVENSGIYAGANFQSLHSTNGTTDQVIINAARTDNANFTIGAGQYIAKLKLNLLKSGHSSVSFTSLNFRRFDGLGGQTVVNVTGNNGEVKSYLGDVAASFDTLSTGDGLIRF